MHQLLLTQGDNLEQCRGIAAQLHKETKILIEMDFNLDKAELQQVGFFALNFFPRDFLLIKKFEIEKTNTTWYTTFKTV